MRIAVVGKMRSGKNTVADMLSEQYGLEQFAFADGITEIIEKYFPEACEFGKPRGHYQQIGQGLRELNPNVWVNYLDKRIQGADNVIVTDCRQKNEEQYLRERGFLIIKIEAPELVRINRILRANDIYSSDTFNHDTEKQVDLIQADIIIHNNNTLDELAGYVSYLFKDIGGK